jgi:hypothetical protein
MASVLAVAVGFGCASSPRESEGAATPPAASSIAVGVVWWPASPLEGADALASDVEARLTTRIRDVAPEVTVVSQRIVRDALYPLLEPATQPASEAAFAALLAREDVRARLTQRGLRYLVAFTGKTEVAAPGGFILCGAGYGGGGCFGLMWQGENTTLDAAVWPLADGVEVRREHSEVEGAFVMPAFVLPIPIPARTMAAACRKLGTRIAEAIREMESERVREGR